MKIKDLFLLPHHALRGSQMNGSAHCFCLTLNISRIPVIRRRTQTLPYFYTTVIFKWLISVYKAPQYHRLADGQGPTEHGASYWLSAWWMPNGRRQPVVREKAERPESSQHSQHAGLASRLMGTPQTSLRGGLWATNTLFLTISACSTTLLLPLPSPLFEAHSLVQVCRF